VIRGEGQNDEKAGKMTRRRVYMRVFLVSLSCLVSMTSTVTADVVPGDVIDSSNWQKAEGLLPKPVLDWVKRGEFILNIGELDVEDPTKIRSDYILEAFETNRGKYAIDEKGGVVDKKNGELVKCIVGFPSPTSTRKTRWSWKSSCTTISTVST